MKEQINIAVIGCGAIAQHAHLPAIKRLRSYNLKGVSDPYIEVAREVARLNGLSPSQGHENHENLLDDPEIEAICICAPTTLHASLVEQALTAGKHVLVEKPMAVTTEEAHRMIAAAEKSGKCLMVGYNHSYDPATRELGRMLRDGELGDIRYAEAFFYEDLYAWTAGALSFKVRAENQPSFWPKYENAYENLREFIHNFGSHITNLFRILLGEPQKVNFAQGDDQNVLLALLDYRKFPLLFKCVRGKQATFEKGLEICGSKKRVRLDLAPPLQRYTPGRLTITDMESQSTTVKTLHWVWPFEEEHRHFSECIRNGTPPLTSGSQALGDVQLAEEISKLATS